MKVAIVALTPKGLELALKVSAAYNHDPRVYYPADNDLGNVIAFKSSLCDLVKDLFGEYNHLLFVMSVGIVVRVIAPYIKDKYNDPAVVVMDEQGRHVISLLSGHLGGANAFTNALAAIIKATPVITTASDLQGKMALDVLAREKNLLIEPKENLKLLNSALVKELRVAVFHDESLTNPWHLKELLGNWAEIAVLDNPHFEEYDAVAFLTSRCLKKPKIPCVYLRPQNLSLGVGCRAGISKKDILAAIHGSLEMTRCSLKSVKNICSVDIKEHEQGLLEAAQCLGLPLKFFTRAEIDAKIKSQTGLSKSEFVHAKIGVEGVCEPAALLGGNSARLILPKTRWQGVTVAIAEGSWQL